MNFWVILGINGSIGVIMVIIMSFVLNICGAKEFGSRVSDETMDAVFDAAVEGNSRPTRIGTLASWTISAMITIFLWEIVLPIEFTIAWSDMQNRSGK